MAIVVQACVPPEQQPAPVKDSNLLPAATTIAAAADPVALAGAVLAKNKGSLQALTTAVQASGLAVKEADGSIARKPAEPKQGVALQAGELLGIEKLEERGYQVPLDDLLSLVAAIAFGRTSVDRPKARAAMLAQLAATAASSTATSRFEARFLAELGKQGAGKYDLLAETAPPSIALDAVQASLFLLQVVRVTAGLAGPKKVAAVKGPCDLNSREQAAYGVDPQTIADADKAMVAVLAGDPSQATMNAAATSALALFDYLVAFSVLHRQVAVAGSVPLVRTKQTDKDLEVRRVVATVKLEVNPGQFARCVRTLAATAHLGVSLPDNGPLQGLKLKWDFANNADDYLKFEACCNNKDAKETYTDRNGQSMTQVEGQRQSRPVADNAPKITRKAGVTFAIDHNLDLFRAIQSGEGAGLGVTLGPPQLDLLQRLLDKVDGDWAGFGFPVTDWAHDYQVDVVFQGVTFKGTKCDTLDSGDWKIDGAGTISEQGFSETINMTVNVHLQSRDGGPYDGTVHTHGEGGPVTADIDGVFNGNAKVALGDGGSGSIDLGTVTATVIAGGSGPGASLQLSLSGSGSSNAVFPFTAGTFEPPCGT